MKKSDFDSLLCLIPFNMNAFLLSNKCRTISWKSLCESESVSECVSVCCVRTGTNTIEAKANETKSVVESHSEQDAQLDYTI